MPFDTNTDRVIVPVAPERAGKVSLKGSWGDLETYGPGSVVIELKTIAGATWASHRLTADVTFKMPPRTERVEAVVTTRTPGMALELVIEQAAEVTPPNIRSRPKMAADPLIVGRWYTPTEAVARERRLEAYRAASKENSRGARAG